MATDALTVSETATLTRLEKTISAGLQAFIEVGTALLHIRDKNLYRARHKTFEAYCQEKWNLERAHAYRLIEAAEVVEDVSPTGRQNAPSALPANERQVRPLAKLPREDRREAWQEIVETAPAGKPTGKHAEEVVRRRIAQKAEPPKLHAPRRPIVKADIEEIYELLDKLVELVNRSAAQALGHNNHSRIVLATLQKAIGEVKAMEKSWSNRK